MSNFVKYLSVFGCGIGAAILANELVQKKDIDKAKSKVHDILSKAKGDTVEYVNDVDTGTCLKLTCKPDYAGSLCDLIAKRTKTLDVTLHDIIETGWLTDDTVKGLHEMYTLDEIYTMGWTKETFEHCGYSAGNDWFTVNYPDFIDKAEVDICNGIESTEDYTDYVDLLGDAYELSTSSTAKAYTIMGDLFDKMHDDGYVSIATVMQVIYDVDTDDRTFTERFRELSNDFDDDTLANYGWTDMDVFYTPIRNSGGKFLIIRPHHDPHNISKLVEADNEKHREEYLRTIANDISEAEKSQSENSSEGSEK